ncbi:hypothetical protein ABZ897_54035 [Nonomuraea sp. NPDC046802]|uniref:hypothetical protein n=1 Tax=Nonomuraea sp. NPDC046802 TaxID=3154919 RepID=UPI0033F321A4
MEFITATPLSTSMMEAYGIIGSPLGYQIDFASSDDRGDDAILDLVQEIINIAQAGRPYTLLRFTVESRT